MKKHKSSEALRLLHLKFENLVKLYLEVDKIPRRYGTDEKLTSLEIHLIEVIGDYDETLSVTDLAKHTDVTKGAISQRLKKLEQKGLTAKEEDPLNLSRSIVTLTSKGKAAHYSHKHWHETMDGGYLDYMAGLEDDKAEFLFEFLDRVTNFLQTVIDTDS